MEPADRPTWSSRAWRVATGVLVVLAFPLLAVGIDGASAWIVPLVIGALAVAVTVWALVRTRRQRRDHEDRLTTWAGERAAQAERLRIARDLHDLASHGLGLITVRAAAARGLSGTDGDPERRGALADIERVSRETTTELRRMLTVLRTPGEEAVPLRPAETLDDLSAIVDGARTSGLTPSLEVSDPGEVSAGVQLTVCAVVREGLANTARHAGPTPVRVLVRREGGTVVATVEDGGRSPGWRSRPGAGQGLRGLLERVTALGGTLEAGPTEGGFRLCVRLPDEEHA